MEEEMKNKNMNDLFKAITMLKTADECKNFFRDLCTLSELRAMNERWQVAQQISQKTPYREISKRIGSSTATITRVAYWLHHGKGGYTLMLNRLKNHRGKR